MVWWKNLFGGIENSPEGGYMETAEQRLNSSGRAVEEIVREASRSISEFRRARARIEDFVSERDEEANRVLQEKAK